MQRYNDLNDSQRRRYARNIALDGFGEAGQLRLLNAHAVIIGAGALGSNVAIALAASGVGRITVRDFDTIDISNLQRQTAYTTFQAGMYKVEQLRNRMLEINPEIDVITFPYPVRSDNINELTDNCDIIVEGSDNQATKHLVARVAAEAGIPCVLGGVSGWSGQVTVVSAQDSYSEIFGDAVCGGIMPCAQGGVAGPVAATVAQIQATEVLKILTGAGETLRGRLLVFDALKCTVNIFEIN